MSGKVLEFFRTDHIHFSLEFVYRMSTDIAQYIMESFFFYRTPREPKLLFHQCKHRTRGLWVVRGSGAVLGSTSQHVYEVGSCLALYYVHIFRLASFHPFTLTIFHRFMLKSVFTILGGNPFSPFRSKKCHTLVWHLFSIIFHPFRLKYTWTAC